MNVKKIVIGSVLLCAGLISATYYTGQSYDETVENQLAITKDQIEPLGIKLTYTLNESSINTRRDKYQIEVTEAYFANLGIPTEEIESINLAFNNDCKILPFYLSCDSKIELGEDKFSKQAAPYFEKLQYSITSSLNAITKKLKSTFKLEEYLLKNEVLDLVVSPMSINSYTDLNLEHIKYHMDWQGIKFSIEDSAGNSNVEFGEIIASSKLKRSYESLYVGDTEGTISSIKIDIEAGSKIKLDSTNFYSKTSEIEEQKYQVDYGFDIKEVDVDGFQHAVVKNVDVDLSLKGISQEFFKIVSSINQQYSPEDPESVIAIINAVGENPLTLNVENLNYIYNDVLFTSSGNAELAEFTYDDVVSQILPEKVNATYSIKIGKNVTDVIPNITPMLDQYIQLGMITNDEEGNLETTITIKDRILSANGVAVTQL